MLREGLGPSDPAFSLSSLVKPSFHKEGRPLARSKEAKPEQQRLTEAQKRFFRQLVELKQGVDELLEHTKRIGKAYQTQDLAHDAYPLYERFRPDIPEGKKGWGAKGDLDLGWIERLAKEKG
jgi:hypothetical protein